MELLVSPMEVSKGEMEEDNNNELKGDGSEVKGVGDGG